MKNLIAFCLLLVLTSCTTLESHKGWCRHDALYVAAVLSEQYPAPGMVNIEILKGKSDFGEEYHAQVYLWNGHKRRYFKLWHGYVNEAHRDVMLVDGWEVIETLTLKEFFNSQYKWQRF